jgi:hypothetical protein
MNMYPLNDEALRREHALNREPLIKARAEQRRLLAEAGLVRRSRFSGEVSQLLGWLGQHISAVRLRLLPRRFEVN